MMEENEQQPGIPSDVWKQFLSELKETIRDAVAGNGRPFEGKDLSILQEFGVRNSQQLGSAVFSAKVSDDIRAIRQDVAEILQIQQALLSASGGG